MTEEQKKYYNAMKKLGSKKPQKPIPRPTVWNTQLTSTDRHTRVIRRTSIVLIKTKLNSIIFFIWHKYMIISLYFLLEQVSRHCLWLYHQTSLRYCHYDPDLLEHGDHDGGNWWPDKWYGQYFVLDKPGFHRPLHWRMCAQDDLPPALLLHHWLECVWLCRGDSVNCW